MSLIWCNSVMILSPLWLHPLENSAHAHKVPLPTGSNIDEHLLRAMAKDFTLLFVHVEKIDKPIKLMPTVGQVLCQILHCLIQQVLLSLMRKLKFREAEDFTQDHAVIKLQSQDSLSVMGASFLGTPSHSRNLPREIIISFSSDEAICVAQIPLKSQFHRSSFYNLLPVLDACWFNLLPNILVSAYKNLILVTLISRSTIRAQLILPNNRKLKVQLIL